MKQNDNQTVSLNGEVPSQNQNSQSDQLPTQSQQSAEASATNSQPDQALPESSQSGDISSQSKQSDKPTDPNQQSGQVPSQNQQSGPASSPSDIAPAQNLPSDQVHVVNQTSGQTSTPSHPSDKVPSSDHQSVQNASTNQNDVKSANLTNESKILPDQPPSPVNNTPVLNDTSEPPNLPVVKHDKSLDTICDICKCSDSILSNPYYINCTKSLLDHKIPPWGKLFDTEFTEVDNVHLLLSLNGFVTVPVITKAMPIDAIDFSQNDISVIEPFAFGGLPHLKRLSLSRNSLNNLDGNVFGVKNETFLSLEILDLSYNVITHLPNDIFEKTRYLQELNLEGNPFQVLDSSTIAALNSLTALQILNLANMELKELPMGLINPVQHLYGLNLADNNFVRIPEVIQHGRNLEHLVLSGNLMTEFGAHSFIELNNLKVIEINNLEHLKAIHKGKSVLEYHLDIFRERGMESYRL